MSFAASVMVSPAIAGGSKRRAPCSSRRALRSTGRSRTGGTNSAASRRSTRNSAAAEQAADLAGRIGLALAERRAFHVGPHAAPVGRHHQQAAVVLQHAPDLAQQAAGVFGRFQPVQQQDAVEAEVGEGQRVFLAGAGEVGQARRPAHRRPWRRGQRDAALGLFAPQPQVGRGVAQARARTARPATARSRPAARAAGGRPSRPAAWRRIRRCLRLARHAGPYSTDGAGFPASRRAGVHGFALAARPGRYSGRMITVQPVANLRDNYAWLLRDAAPAPSPSSIPAEPGPVVAAIDAAGGRLDLILLTHHHADHIAGDRRDARPLWRPRGRRPCRRASAARARPGRSARATGGAGRDGGPGDRNARPHARPHRLYFADGGRAVLRRYPVQPGLRPVARGHRGGDVRLARQARRAAGRRRWFIAATNTPRATPGSRSPPTPPTRRCSDTPKRCGPCAPPGQPTVPSLLADELAANPFLRAPDVAAFADLRARKDKF